MTWNELITFVTENATAIAEVILLCTAGVAGALLNGEVAAGFGAFGSVAGGILVFEAKKAEAKRRAEARKAGEAVLTNRFGQIFKNEILSLFNDDQFIKIRNYIKELGKYCGTNKRVESFLESANRNVSHSILRNAVEAAEFADRAEEKKAI
ncbi:MAG: hypothetical protein LBJ32_02155 [Oscillospiraceae bacterium]|jgi:hypothetical protein|nr:hypothetical protein [Oscillospiraceae bacterium]